RAEAMDPIHPHIPQYVQPEPQSYVRLAEIQEIAQALEEAVARIPPVRMAPRLQPVPILPVHIGGTPGRHATPSGGAIGWGNLIAVAKPATSNAVNDWVTHAWIPVRDGTVMAITCVTIPGGFWVDGDPKKFKWIISEALAGAGASDGLSQGFSTGMWNAWHEW